MSTILEVCQDVKRNFVQDYRKSGYLGKAARVVGLGVLTLGTIGLAARVTGVASPLAMRPIQGMCRFGWNMGASLLSKGLQVTGYALGGGATLVKEGLEVITEKAPSTLKEQIGLAKGKASAIVASSDGKEKIAAAAGSASKALGYAQYLLKGVSKTLDYLDKNVLSSAVKA